MTLGLALACAGAVARADPAPGRVVSINLCTDQLAMMLAAPGQLVSVSRLAGDPHSSAMAEQAQRYPVNQGRAEEVYLLRPDLVLAGVYTDPATVQMLRRVGLRVEQFDTAKSLADTRARIAQMARVLGREEAGAALIAAFDARLAALEAPTGPRPRAALYHPNGYTLGGGTLADDILRAAGLRNLAAELGHRGGGTLPLEELVMAAPDLLISAAPLPGASRSEAVLAHPALAHLRATRAGLRITSPDWICGTPHVLGAVARVAAARRALPEGRQ
jgi:iron complex transport system substrate-binding protein